MTVGEAMFRAACESLNLDPDARGSATRLHAQCGDLCTLGQLSEWRRGRYSPRPATVEAFGKRFGFRLVQSWSWHATTDRTATMEFSDGSQIRFRAGNQDPACGKLSGLTVPRTTAAWPPDT